MVGNLRRWDNHVHEITSLSLHESILDILESSCFFMMETSYNWKEKCGLKKTKEKKSPCAVVGQSSRLINESNYGAIMHKQFQL